MTPMPPSRAIAMAVLPSVTVSMAALTRGTLSRIVFVSHVDVLTSPGITLDMRGMMETSSKVMAEPTNFFILRHRLAGVFEIISEADRRVQIAHDEARQQFWVVIRRFLRHV